MVTIDLRIRTPQQFANMVVDKLAALASAAPGTGIAPTLLDAGATADTPAPATPEGTVVAWGDNSTGQCQVPPWLSGVTAIAAGGGLSFALTSAGIVAAWGNKRYQQCDVPDCLTGVTAIAAGFNYGLAVSDGEVTGWGVAVPAMQDIPPGLTGVIAVAASILHSLAVTREGTVVTWGTPAEESSENTKLSARLLSWMNKKLVFDLFQVPSGLTQVVNIAAGFTYSIALTSDGAVVGWGGFHSTNPFRVPSGPSYSVPEDLPKITAIASGANHSLAMTSKGTVEAWGHNRSGQCNVPDGLTG